MHMKDYENVILSLGTKLRVRRQFNLDNENTTGYLIMMVTEDKDYKSKAHICPIETS